MPRAWSAIIGPSGESKSDPAWRVARALEQRGLRVGGFVQREARDARGAVAGWDLERIPTRERIALARASATPELCTYSFDGDAFARGADWLTEPGLDFAFVGGVGKLEAARRGHWPAITAALRAPLPGAHLVLCVRSDCLSPIALSLSEDPTAWLELPATDASLAAFVARLAGSLGGASEGVRA